MQARRLIIGYIFYICISIAIVYIYGFAKLKNLWAPLLGYYIFSYLFHIVWSKIKGNTCMDLFGFFILFLYKSAIYLSIFTLAFGGFLYFQNNILPAKLPSHTLSNGKQIVVFQTMSHIGSQDFYSSVIKKIQTNKLSGFVLYYEGVLPGNEKNTQNFNQALGINFAPGLYDNFSKLYGVRAQDNGEFLNIVNNLDYNIDLNLDEVMKLYREKITDNDGASSSNIMEDKKIIDINTQVISQLSQLGEKELILLRYVNQGMLNFMIKHGGLRDFLISRLADQDIFSVILDDRNKHLAREILTRKDEKVMILYGLMHFQGVLELLQSQDASWKIISTQYQQVISN